MIEKPDLDAKQPIGNGVNGVEYKEGESTIIATKSADMTNSSTDLNQTYDQTNRSAKYKYPQNKQDKGIMYSDQK